MIEGAEGIGEAVTGGLAARSIEPAAGEAHSAGEGTCLNCGASLVGDYCHACGQPGHVHRTVAAWWHDLAHGVLHFEGKIWRTLPLLAWRPGELTRRYIEGERARFVSPMAMFLFTVFLMFALFSALGESVLGIESGTPAEAAAELRRADGRIAELEARQRALQARGRPDPRIAEALREARLERRMVAAVSSGEPLFEGEAKTGWGRLDRGLKKANENPALLSYKLQANAYKFSWALVPISLPFLWLLFLHRRRYRKRFKAYDHLVFITYSISFMSMLLIAFVLLRAVGVMSGLLNFAFVLAAPLHVYRQLKGAYGLSRPSALWRTAALLASAMLTVGLFFLLLVGLGILA